jgi:hypothetical protein
MSEGQPLPRPRVLLRPDPVPDATGRAEGIGNVRAGDLGRRARRNRSATAWGDRDARCRGGAAVLRRRQPEPAVDDGHQREVLRPHGCLEARAGDLWADGRTRDAHDERVRTGHGCVGTRACASDHPLGNQHEAHQPPPVADDRGRPRPRRPAGRDRPDPYADRRRDRRIAWRSLRPAPARHRHRDDAGDDARDHPRRADERRVDRPAHERLRRTAHRRRRLDTGSCGVGHRRRRHRHRATRPRVRDGPARRHPHPDRRRTPRERGDVPPNARLPASAHRRMGRARAVASRRASARTAMRSSTDSPSCAPTSSAPEDVPNRAR